MKSPLTFLLAASLSATAHVPYLEEQDYSLGSPFFDFDVAQSIAIYAWLESPEDVDVVVCWVRQPTRLFVETLVPVCPAYKSFFPCFAVLGPGLPPPAVPVIGPYRLAVLPWADQSEPRDVFYEPFGNKSYYQGPAFDQQVAIPGPYFIFVWNPAGMVGDYVLPIGREERWPLPDIIRALIVTPMIRDNLELHSPCGE